MYSAASGLSTANNVMLLHSSIPSCYQHKNVYTLDKNYLFFQVMKQYEPYNNWPVIIE